MARSLGARQADGTIFPVELSIQAAEGEEGEIFVGFLRDISRRVAAEAELVSARDQAVAGERAKSEFMAVMSHEMRTPLNGLLGTLSLLKDTSLNAKQKAFVSNLETSGSLLLHHINDVLDITKYEAGKLTISQEPVDLGELIQSVVENQRALATAADNTVEWRWVGKPFGPVMTDPRRLRQVLINLVGNAVKFTHKGRIDVEIDATRREGEGNMADVDIRVTDTGIGIAADQIERVFRDFETGDTSYARETGGTGLGLGIARRLADALGGTIGVTSTPGVGSRFWVRLPLRLAEPVALPRSARKNESARGGTPRSVLVVEDNEINREVLREMLEADGHSVVEAHNGLEGLQAANRRAFDLILTDISMPEMDGLEATKAIRTGTGPCHAVPIFAVTAHAMPSEVSGFSEAGFTGILPKPINRSDLRQILAAPNAPRGKSIVSSAEPPASELDLAHLRDTAEQLGATTFERMLAKFLNDGDRTVETLVGARDRGLSNDEVKNQAHKLAGAAAIFGATGLRAHLASIETAVVETGDSEAVRALIETLGPLWRTTREGLEAARASDPSSP